jgi:ribose transport system substrate-binding protein
VCFLILGIGAVIFAGGSKQGGSKSRLIGFAVSDQSTPFFVVIRDVVQEAITARGDQFISVDGKLDQVVQNNGIEDLITRGVEILFVNPVDSQSIQPALEACRKAGVKVIVFDSAVDRADLTDTFISSNNFQAGELDGKEIVRLYPNGAKIALLENPAMESVRSRVAGLEAGIKGSKSTIIARKALGSYDQVISATEDMIQAYPEIDVFWSLNDPAALMMLGAVESAGIAGKVRVFSIDGAPSGKKSIADGGLYATAAQSPRTMGKTMVDVAYKLLAGEKVEPVISIDTFLITRENIKQYSADQWE